MHGKLTPARSDREGALPGRTSLRSVREIGSSSAPRWRFGLVCVVLSAMLLMTLFERLTAQEKPAVANQPAKTAERAAAQPKYVTEALRGRVVWMAEALKRRYGIESDADTAQSQAAIETNDGRLYPLVKDIRGRGFWLDPRLRGTDLELVVRRYEHSPAVQVVGVYTIKQGRKYELDYWCDICAIPMYELKQCECCQGPTRLRESLVEKSPE